MEAGTEEQVVMVVKEREGVFLSETSLNAERCPDSRFMLWRQSRRTRRRRRRGAGGLQRQICVHSCVGGIRPLNVQRVGVCACVKARHRNREHHCNHRLWLNE